MTKKKQKQMLENWVKYYNPKATLQLSDGRCGKRYAVMVESHNPISDYLTLDELEQFLLGVSHAEEFLRNIRKSA